MSTSFPNTPHSHFWCVQTTTVAADCCLKLLQARTTTVPATSSSCVRGLFTRSTFFVCFRQPRWRQTAASNWSRLAPPQCLQQQLVLVFRVYPQDQHFVVCFRQPRWRQTAASSWSRLAPPQCLQQQLVLVFRVYPQDQHFLLCFRQPQWRQTAASNLSRLVPPPCLQQQVLVLISMSRVDQNRIYIRRK